MNEIETGIWAWLLAAVGLVGVLIKIEWIIKKASALLGKGRGLILRCAKKHLTKQAYADLEEGAKPFFVRRTVLDQTTQFLETASEDAITLRRHNPDKDFLIALRVGKRAVTDIYPATWEAGTNPAVSVDKTSANKIIESLRIARSYWEKRDKKSEILVAEDLISKYDYQSRKNKKWFWFR